MELAEQVGLIRDFMVAIAPEVTRHRLCLIRRHLSALVYDEEQMIELQHDASLETARITLETAMHLAGQFANCRETLQAAAPEDPVASVQHKTTSGTGGL
jgi:hypothetical protein